MRFASIFILLVAISVPVQADVIIDTFEDWLAQPGGTLRENFLSGMVGPIQTTAPNAFTGIRDEALHVHRLPGINCCFSPATGHTLSILEGRMSIINPMFVSPGSAYFGKSETWLQYDGDDHFAGTFNLNPYSGSSMDLTNEEAIVLSDISFVGHDATSATITITLGDDTPSGIGGDFGYLRASAADIVNGSLVMNLSGVSADPLHYLINNSLDMSNITRIGVYIEMYEALSELHVGQIASVTSVSGGSAGGGTTAVPSPASWLLALCGFAFLGSSACRRRLNRLVRVSAG